MINIIREITQRGTRDTFVWHYRVFKWGLATWECTFGHILSFIGLKWLFQVDGHDSTFGCFYPVTASALGDLWPHWRWVDLPCRQIADICPTLTLILRKLRLYLLPKLAYSLVDICYEYSLIHLFGESMIYELLHPLNRYIYLTCNLINY